MATPAGKLVPVPPVKVQPNVSTEHVHSPVMPAGGHVQPANTVVKVQPNVISKPAEPSHVAATKRLFGIY
jgi:hypothetical protein